MCYTCDVLCIYVFTFTINMVKKQATKKTNKLSTSGLNMRPGRMSNAEIVRALIRLQADVDRGRRYMLTPRERRMLAPSNAASVAAARGFGQTRTFGTISRARRSMGPLVHSQSSSVPARPRMPAAQALQRSRAATRIQALYRGHLTRRSLRM